MGVPETDLIEEMDLSSVECLNMVRPPARSHRLARVPPTQDERTAGEIYPPPDPPLASDPRRSQPHPTHAPLASDSRAARITLTSPAPHHLTTSRRRARNGATPSSPGTEKTPGCSANPTTTSSSSSPYLSGSSSTSPP
jgi:hypothetical protein